MFATTNKARGEYAWVVLRSYSRALSCLRFSLSSDQHQALLDLRHDPRLTPISMPDRGLESGHLTYIA